MASHDFQVRRLAGWSDVSADWLQLARNGRATPFQTPTFLGAWYEALATRPGIEPVIVEARTAEGVPALLLPLILRRQKGLHVLGFTDDGVSDNNAPVIGPGAPRDTTGFAALWRQVRAALPRADMLLADRQPAHLGGLPNPMLHVGQALTSLMTAHPLAMGDSWDDYSRSRTTKFRKEQERVWRVFTRTPGAGFELVTNAERALAVLADMERLQKARMEDIGVSYRLDQPAYRAFYRALIREGIADGSVRLGVLSAGEETVAALMGLYDGKTATFVRLGHAGGAWSTSSPGRLVIERTLMALHADGVRHFDFSIGDHHYKENFLVGSSPLARTAVALSPGGQVGVAALRLREWLRKSERLRALVHRVRGQSAQSLARST